MQRAFGELPSRREVRWLNNGNDAILYLCGHQQFNDRAKHPMPSLVLLDLKLPVKNGFEVLRWLRGYRAFAAIPVIAFSDCFDGRIVQRAYELGANSYLQKPRSNVERRRIVEALQNYWLTVNMTNGVHRRDAFDA